MVATESSILKKLKADNIKEGDILELLIRSAEYDDSFGSRLFYHSWKEEIKSQKILGYFKSITKQGIVLEDNLGELIIKDYIIQSYNILKTK